MDRRNFIHGLAAVGASGAWGAQAATTAALPQRPAAELGEQLAAGSLQATALVAACLARIDEIDRRGPALRALISINPDADTIAAALDERQRRGDALGPLHGMPVVLKDSIATGDRMPTTMGSLALDGVRCHRDAALVRRLREAGAVVLGKSNLSEWCNARSPNATAGWSATGGLTRNPHVLD
ncbi:MAG: amidase family protein, partial [Roseateles sp.]